MSDLAYSHGGLIPIESPLNVGDDGDIDKALRDYGFPLHSWKFGVPESGDGFEVFGPAHFPEGRPYQFVCEWTLSSTLQYIWCENWAELHHYLVWAAPLLQQFQMEILVEEVSALRDQMRQKAGSGR
jgi:hypothetical protein